MPPPLSVYTSPMNCVVVCIGTDKISGDSLGPIVGSLLRDKHRLPCPVYGVEGKTVNGLNLADYRRFLLAHHPDSTVIAVDAAVGRPDELGTVKIRKGGIKAGGALGRDDPIGDVGVLGVVGIKGGDALATLMAVPYPEVVALAEKIALRIATTLKEAA